MFAKKNLYELALIFSANFHMPSITKKHYFFIFTLLLLFGARCCAKAVASSSIIKKQLLDIYQTHRKTFFCDEAFSEKGEVLYYGCPRCPPIKMNIQWMAIVPIEQLAKNLNCYHQKICLDKTGQPFKGLRCCEISNDYFKRMKGDLHNLVPELPNISRQRLHKRFGAIAVNEIHDKGCHYYIDHKNKLIDPSPQVRGMIARTYLYMRTRYPLLLSPDEFSLYLQWHQKYPVTQWERERNHKIQQYQGNSNPYIT